MILPEFHYLAPESLEEAIEILSKYGYNAQIMAGGTDIINPMKEQALKEGADRPAYLVDIKNIPGLDQITYSETEGLHIGCLVKDYDVEHSPVIRDVYPSLAGAAQVIASNQIRSRGTIVGNICNASASADSVPTLMVLGANAEILGPNGKRKASIEDLNRFKVDKQAEAAKAYDDPTRVRRYNKLALAPGEMITGISIPPMEERSAAGYIKHAYRKAMDLAIVGVAAWIKMNGNTVENARIAMASVGPRTMRGFETEKVLIGKELTEELIAEAAKAASLECKPRDGIRASEEYKRAMIEVYTKRVINKAVYMIGKPGKEYVIS